MKKLLYSLFIAFAFTSCSNEESKSIDTTREVEITEGRWVLNFQLANSNNAPTIFILKKVEENYQVEFLNAEEHIMIKDVQINGDKIIITDPIFNTWFEGKIESPTAIKGYWYKENDEYKIPFKASLSNANRFNRTGNTTTDVTGKWEVDFSKNQPDDHYKAIGQFEQNGNLLKGTFMTETGDYRFLEGNVYNDSLFLSCFDGAHLFLFNGQVRNDSLLGMFWSGTHHDEPWVATRNEEFELRNPDSLTYLKEGYDKLAFTFPTINGDSVSLSDEKYKGKVVIVNIMGPWCPNCKDETAYLTKLYKQNKEKGLEIIALSFDRSDDFKKAAETADKIKSHFGAEYDFLIAGKASKIEAAKALPMLNHIMSYPTSIFIDRQGNIRKIRTGFYGPSTGEYYVKYTEQTNRMVEKLLSE